MTRREIWYALAVAALIAIGAARVASTYSIFTQTYDEPLHIAAGLEILDRGTFIFSGEHPPLARLLMAAPLYWKGLHAPPPDNLDIDGNKVLYANGEYWKNISLARMGNLVFFALSGVILYLWGRRWFSPLAGLIAALVFLTFPGTLGHAGLATLDMACAATLAVAFYQFIRYLEQPTWKRAIWMGLGFGIALASKLSSVPFLAVGGAVGVLCLLLMNTGILLKEPVGQRAKQIVICCAMTFVVIWATYLFSMETGAPKTEHQKEVAEKTLPKNPVLRKVATIALNTPLPMTAYARALFYVTQHSKRGNPSYLLGEARTTGWWYFFPVVIAVKTPIGFLLVAVAAVLWMLWRFPSLAWQQRLTLLFPLAILAFCMVSTINMGVRHILPVYAMIAVVMGHFVASMIESPALRRLPVVPVLLLALIAWGVGDGALNHPDYMAYFNQFAGSHPQHVLAESDLDWGQDLNRLSIRLHELNAPSVNIGYFGTARLNESGLPPYREIPAFSTAARPAPESFHGYTAISIRYLTIENAMDGSYAWLKSKTPLERVGRSIFLYKLD